MDSAPVNYTFEEYKILQDKTDKIGAFRFTIKGWSITAVVGGLVAISAEKVASPHIVGGILCACLFWLFLFERQQVILSWKFGIRAIEIEDEIDRARLAGSQPVIPSPRIANILARRGIPIRKEGSQRARLKKLKRKLRRELRLAWKSDVVFYLTLMALSWIPAMHPLPRQHVPTKIVVSGSLLVTPTPTSSGVEKSVRASQPPKNPDPSPSRALSRKGKK